MSEMNTQEPPEVPTVPATDHELEIERASAPVLEVLYSGTQGQTEAATRIRAIHAEKAFLYLENLVKLAVDNPWLSPDVGMIPINKIVDEHGGHLKSTVADPRFQEAVSELVQQEDIRFLDGDGNPSVTSREILSFVRASVAVEAEALAQERAASVASGAIKAAELGQLMHFGVEGHSREDNARRLEAAQAVQAVLMRDGWDMPTAEPFSLTSVIKHGGNLSEVVNDPGLYEDLRDNLNLPFVVPETAEEESIDCLDHGTNQDYFDSVVASLKLKEQYGTDKSFQKAMQAATFASTQQQFPVAHASAGKGKTTTTNPRKTPVQHQRQQPGLAR